MNVTKAKMIVKLLLLGCLHLQPIMAFCDLSTSFPWQPNWMPPRDDLYCTSHCERYNNPVYDQNSTHKEKDECCTCNSCTLWEASGSLTNLAVEYVTVTGKTLAVPEPVFDNATQYAVVHTNGEMADIPSNLCTWDTDRRISSSYGQYLQDITPFWTSIVKIDFTSNRITTIENLNCLTQLDTLTLSHNKIQYLSNTSISQLSYLRVLDLAGNQLKDMQPGVLFSQNINIFFANFSYNELTNIDITNVMLRQPYCSVDYSHNQIDEVINSQGFKLDTSQTYGPGFVSFVENAFEKFPDLTTLLSLENLAQWGQLISSGFDFRGIQLSCDCNLEQFSALAADLRDTLWRDYFNVTCVTPAELKGQTAVNVDPASLICPLDAQDNCPSGCTCVDQPSTDTLYINCSNANLKTFPSVVPESNLSKYISLDLSHNFIDKIDNASYLHKLTHLDISNNPLDQITNGDAENLEKTQLNLNNNIRLRELPQVFQFRNLCSLYTEQVTIDCTCETLWIEQWFEGKYKYCNRKNHFKCDVPGTGVIPAQKFSSSLLECEPDDTILRLIFLTLAVLLFVILISAILIYIFRYELLVLYLRAKQTQISQFVGGFEYNVIVSYNEEDPKLRAWIYNELYPKLNCAGYSVFLPEKDTIPGDDRDYVVAHTMPKSRSFLLILSESYLEEPNETDMGRCWTKNEWKYAWHQFRKDRNKNIVIVNYDHVWSSDVKHPQIKAYLRVGHTVHFGNHDNNVIDEIFQKLGPTNQGKNKVLRCADNYKTRFKPKGQKLPTQKRDTRAVPPPVFSNTEAGTLCKATNKKPILKWQELMGHPDEINFRPPRRVGRNCNKHFPATNFTFPSPLYMDKASNHNEEENEPQNKQNGQEPKHTAVRGNVKVAPQWDNTDTICTKRSEDIALMFLSPSSIPH